MAYVMAASALQPKICYLGSGAFIGLTIMHSTSELGDLKLKGQPPNVRLHKLKGRKSDRWSVTIKLPWCITFRFKGGEFWDVKIEDYH